VKYFVLGSTYVVRLDAGERIVETLEALCARDAIGAGYFNGLGAIGQAEIGHFDPGANEYGWVRLEEPCEITLTRFRDDIGRRRDEATGLWTLALEPGGD
jgi:predicted DNA-binding protein with PD1-like motif